MNLLLPCIEFEGSKCPDGYGRVVGGESAHRVAWVKAKGPIPEGMQVLHGCDNPPCWNVEHLFLGTHQDNMRDRNAKGRQGRPRGSTNGNALLDEDKVREIKAYLSQDRYSLAELADMYGVVKPTIVHIKMGRTWSHV